MSQVPVPSDFIPFVGETFTPRGQHRVLTLTSVVTQPPVAWGSAPREPFTLILRGPRGDVLPEGLYDVAMTGRPDIALYIIPIHTVARDRQDYQIVFS